MTEAEIIKALEEEIHLAKYVDSDYCSNTEVSLIKAALDLINRQNAELERLKEIKIELEDAYREQENYEDMIIKGTEVCARCHEEYAEKIKQAKAEAIKEFAERLKANFSKFGFSRQMTPSKHIDNLVKEMAGAAE